MLTDNEQQAVEQDAKTRLVELRADRRRLWPDRADDAVALELHRIISDIPSCESELGLNRQTSRAHR
jgi:hypothetical protein